MKSKPSPISRRRVLKTAGAAVASGASALLGSSVVAAQQGVNFCDDADAAVLAAKNFALSGSSSEEVTDTLLPALTADMISVNIERIDAESGVPVACDCSVTGCDTADGGGPPDFVVVSIPNGFEVNPRIPFLTLDPILLRPMVRIPYGGT